MIPPDLLQAINEHAKPEGYAVSSGLDSSSPDELVHKLDVMLSQIKGRILQKLDGPVYLADIPIQEDEDPINTRFPPNNLIWPCKGDQLRHVLNETPGLHTLFRY